VAALGCQDPNLDHRTSTFAGIRRTFRRRSPGPAGSGAAEV